MIFQESKDEAHKFFRNVRADHIEMLSFGSLFAGVCGKGLVAEDDTASGLAEGPAQIVGAVLNHPSRG